MKKYKTTQILSLFSGKVGLTEAQASVRMRALTHVGDGVFEIVGPVEFKAGELLGFDEVPKAILPKLEDQARADMEEGELKPSRPAKKKTVAKRAAPKRAAASLKKK